MRTSAPAQWLCAVTAMAVALAAVTAPAPAHAQLCDPTCENGGVCSDGTCACATGFSGAQCQTDDDECASQPCANGGVCVDGIGSFACQCAAGFDGPTCSVDVDECASQPCANGGSCTDAANGFSCGCTSAFTGPLCLTPVAVSSTGVSSTGEAGGGGGGSTEPPVEDSHSGLTYEDKVIAGVITTLCVVALCIAVCVCRWISRQSAERQRVALNRAALRSYKPDFSAEIAAADAAAPVQPPRDDDGDGAAPAATVTAPADVVVQMSAADTSAGAVVARDDGGAMAFVLPTAQPAVGAGASISPRDWQPHAHPALQNPAAAVRAAGDGMVFVPQPPAVQPQQQMAAAPQQRFDAMAFRMPAPAKATNAFGGGR